jgi:hypothetical protein
LVNLIFMSTPLSRLDPDRRRRRLYVLAEYADSAAQRVRMQPQRARMVRIRELVDNRRRLAS